MTTNDTGWIDVPYAAANFWAKAPLQWKVTEKGVMTYAYRVQGKTMTLSFKIDESTLAGLPANELYIRIPANYLPNRSMANPIWLGSQLGKECGYLTVHPGRPFLVLFRETEGLFPIEPKNFVAFGQLTFEVQ